MKVTGSRSKLAWSNTGSIAQISPDGKKISFRVLVRDRKTGLWTISKASKSPIEAPMDRNFVHIQFNGVGIDLAVVDDAGTLQVHTLSGALGKMIPSTSSIDLARNGPRRELNDIVGLRWLALFPAEFRVSD